MSKRILILLAVILMATGCGRGVKQTPVPSSQVPNLEVPADLLSRDVAMLPQPESGARTDLLSNHVDVAKLYHALGIDFTALVCAITGQQGITINGAKSVRPKGCEARAFRDVKAIVKTVDKSAGPSDGG